MAAPSSYNINTLPSFEEEELLALDEVDDSESLEEVEELNELEELEAKEETEELDELEEFDTLELEERLTGSSSPESLPQPTSTMLGTISKLKRNLRY